MEKKVCKYCKEEKKVDLFVKEKRNKDGLSNTCRDCKNKKRNKEYRTPEGRLLVIYKTMIQNQKKRAKSGGRSYLVKFTREEFVDWGLKNHDYNIFFKEWEESCFKNELSPTFDRINDYGDYSFDNFNCWMTWEDNRKKGNKDRKRGFNVKMSLAVKATNIKTGNVYYFNSCREAERITGVNNSNIGRCCKKIESYDSAGGYIWEYSDINIDKQNNKLIDFKRIKD